MRRHALVILLALTACTTTTTTAPQPAGAPMAPEPPPPPAAAEARPCVPGDVILNATLWMQTAAEYQATARQTYAAARRALEMAIADTRWSALEGAMNPLLPPAIILDLDETVIDNMGFETRMIRSGKIYVEDEWQKWVAEGTAGAVPGATEFLAYAKSRGVTPFYVSNRTADQEASTRRNLVELGVPLSGAFDTVLLKGERADWTSDKTSRRAYVALNHRVLMIFGDDLNDFAAADGKSMAERDAIVRSNGGNWGTKWFMLANPVYGSWERSLLRDRAGDDCSKRVSALRAAGNSADASPTGARAIASLLQVFFEKEDPNRTVKWVAGERIDPSILETAATLRQFSEDPQTRKTLPQGTLALQSVTIDGEKATVTVWRGPIPQARPGELLLDCGQGTIYTFLQGPNGTWVLQPGMGMIVC